MPEPVVSVLLSVHRDRGRLGATLESVSSQSFDRFELIVVNDGGPDELAATLAAARARDARLRILTNGRNLGLTRSLNHALGVARGRYVARIDEGDLWLPAKLDRQMEFLASHPDHVLVGTRYRDYRDTGSPEWSGPDLPVDDGEIRRWLFAGLTPLVHPTILYRRGIVRYNDAAPTSQDFELYLRLSLVGRLGNLADELVRVYRPENAISVENEHVQFFTHAEMHRQFLDVLRAVRDPLMFVESGTDFSNETRFRDARERYMRRCMALLRPLPKRSLARRILRNLLVPDVLLYYLSARSAPYRLRRAFRAYMDHASLIRT